MHGVQKYNVQKDFSVLKLYHISMARNLRLARRLQLIFCNLIFENCCVLVTIHVAKNISRGQVHDILASIPGHVKKGTWGQGYYVLYYILFENMAIAYT